MKKRMLDKLTTRYDKVPSWLMIMLSCLIATGFVLIGGLLAGFIVGIPVALVLFVMMLNGSVQPQDINAIAFKLFSSEYFELGVFAFTALIVFFWVKVVEKRSIRSLGFFRGSIWCHMLKGIWDSTLVSEFPRDLFTWWFRICKSRFFSENPPIYPILNTFLVYPRWNRGAGDSWLVASDSY